MPIFPKMELTLGGCGSLMASSEPKHFVWKASLFPSKPRSSPKRSASAVNLINSPLLKVPTGTTTSTPNKNFSWEDAFQMCRTDVPVHDSSYLEPFFQKIKTCNRGYEKISEFLPFVIEGRILGYIHKNFSSNLRKFKDVFAFVDGSLCSHAGTYVTLDRSLELPEDRTEAVAYVVQYLANQGLIPGIRNELYPVTESYGMPHCFSIERAAAPFFGIKSYAIHVNGYVEKEDEKFMWIGKRSETKSTFPGMLDHIVAGGIPHNITCKENLMKECEEEASIPRSISKVAIPVGAIPYTEIDGYTLMRYALFCYDLKLEDDFFPYNQDAEVESFKLIPMKDIKNLLRNTEFIKPSVNLVILDFLFRHGFLKPEQHGYLKLLKSLRCGDLS